MPRLKRITVPLPDGRSVKTFAVKVYALLTGRLIGWKVVTVGPDGEQHHLDLTIPSDPPAPRKRRPTSHTGV